MAYHKFICNMCDLEERVYYSINDDVPEYIICSSCGNTMVKDFGTPPITSGTSQDLDYIKEGVDIRTGETIKEVLEKMKEDQEHYIKKEVQEENKKISKSVLKNFFRGNKA